MNWVRQSLDSLTPIQMGVIVLVTLIAAVSDLKSRRIPNFLTFPMLATGVAWSAWNRGTLGLLDAVAAAFVLALPFVLLFVYAGGGGGDVKLMAAIGAWAGLIPGAFILVMVSLSGVIMGLVVAAANGKFRLTMRRVAGVAYQAMPNLAGSFSMPHAAPLDHEKMQPMPYGLAIFAGVCLANGVFLLWHA